MSAQTSPGTAEPGSAPEAPEQPAPAPEQPPPAPVLEPPKLLAPVELTLPEGVQAPPGGIEVVLTIDAQGAVTDVQLAQSLGDGADAAVIEAARALRFEPARRDGQPIAARIGFRFELEPVSAPAAPAPGAPGATPPASGAPTDEAGTTSPTPPAIAPGDAAAAAPPAPGPEPELDFGATARVDKPEPGAVSRVRLRGRELTMIPGTFGEPLRVVATLPGVARSPFGLGFFVVRGASFQNTGFFVDGFAVPILYHLGAGPAILSSRLVEQLDFYPGGYPVALGRYTSGVISLRTAPPPADRLQVELEVDLLRAGGLAIVPFGDGRGSVAVAFRRSYYELILPLVTDDVSLSYTDYQLRLDYRLSDTLRASLFFFGSRDAFSASQATGAGATTGTSSAGLEYAFDQLIASLEWKAVPELTLRWSGAAGPTSTDFGSEGTGQASLGADIQALRLGQRLEAVWAPSPRVQTTAGFDENLYVYEVTGSSPSFAELPGIPSPEFIGETIPLDDTLTELGFAPFVEQVVRPWRFELTAGLRMEYLRYGDVRTWQPEPRGVVRYELTDGAKLKLATGLFSQPPLPYQVTRDTANPRLAPNRALQNSIGAEIVFPASVELETTLFYTHMWQLTRGTGRASVDAEGNPVRPFFADDGKGRSYGLELLLRRRIERGLFGWLSYTLSRSERFLAGGRTVVFFYDQTHVLNFAGSYEVDGWTFGARFALATGRPVNDILDPEGDDAVYDADEDDFEPDSRGRRTRLPTYHQLDVRIDRAWRAGPIEGSVFLDVINVYAAPNSEGYQYNYDFTERGRLPGLPFLPTIGVRGVLR